MPSSGRPSSTARRSSSTSTCCGPSTAPSTAASATRPSTTRSRPTPPPRSSPPLAALGGQFDCASRGEIDLCLGLGVAPHRIAFGNTIKRASDIAHAHRMGVEQFAADAEEELHKIATHAPGARVDPPHARRGLRGRLAAQPQVRLLAPRGPAPDGPRPLARARRGRHLLPPRQPGARAADVGHRPRRRARAVDRGGRGRPRPAHPQHRRRLPGLLRRADAADRGLCRRGHAHGPPPLRHRRARDGRARPRPRRRGRRHRRRGGAGRPQGPGRHRALGLSRHRQVLGPRRDHGRGDPLPVRDPPRRRRDRPLHPRRPLVQLGRRALREAAGAAPARARVG